MDANDELMLIHVRQQLHACFIIVAMIDFMADHAKIEVTCS